MKGAVFREVNVPMEIEEITISKPDQESSDKNNSRRDLS